MSARFENEEKINRKVDSILSDLPDYVSEWNMNMLASDKAASTRRDFVSKIALYLKSINESDPKSVKPEEFNSANVTKFFISTRTHYNKYGKKAPTSDSYQCAVWTSLNIFFKFMKKRGYINENFMEMIDRPANHDLERINRNRVRLTPEDFKAILSSVKFGNPDYRERDYAILTIFMNTGMRESALMNSEIDDINFEKRTLTIIDKREKTHVYIINDVMMDALKRWLIVRETWLKDNNERHLFITKNGGGMGVKTIQDVVRKYTEMGIGKALSPHKLRAGVATIIYDKTHDLEFTCKFMGHADASITQRYIVTNGKEREDGAEMLGEIFA